MLRDGASPAGKQLLLRRSAEMAPVTRCLPGIESRVLEQFASPPLRMGKGDHVVCSRGPLPGRAPQMGPCDRLSHRRHHALQPPQLAAPVFESETVLEWLQFAHHAMPIAD